MSEARKSAWNGGGMRSLRMISFPPARPAECARCFTTRTKTCSHLDKKCTMESSLVGLACDNVADKTVSDKLIRDLLILILPKGTNPGLPALSNYVFNFDPIARFGKTADELANLANDVPLSLVTAMRQVGIIDHATVKCWVCDANASIMAVHCAGPDCEEVAHPDCLHFTCPTKTELARIVANVDFFCNTHKNLKKARPITASTNKDDPLCYYCKKGVAAKDVVCCEFNSCVDYHYQCLPGVSPHDDIPNLREFLNTTELNCALDSKEHCFPKFVGVADDTVPGMDGEEEEEEGEGEGEEAPPASTRKRAADTASQEAAKRSGPGPTTIDDFDFGDLFAKDPAATTPSTLARRHGVVTQARVGLLSKIKELCWGGGDLRRVVDLMNEGAATPKVCTMLVVEPFFAAVKRALPSAAAYEAAEFLHPGSRTIIRAAILPYLTSKTGGGGEGGAASDLSASELDALLKAIFPQPSSYDAATGAATVAGQASRVDGSRLEFFNRVCTKPLDAIQVISKAIVEIVEADDPELLLVNRSVEYDANAARDALHATWMHEFYVRAKKTGRMLEFLKREME